MPDGLGGCAAKSKGLPLAENTFDRELRNNKETTSWLYIPLQVHYTQVLYIKIQSKGYIMDISKLRVLIHDDLRVRIFLGQANQAENNGSNLLVERLHVHAPTADSSIRTHLNFIQIKAGIVGLGYGKGNLSTRN